MVVHSLTQEWFSRQHLIIPKKIKFFRLWIYFFTFSCIVAVHQVPGAVNGCIGACELYLKKMMTAVYHHLQGRIGFNTVNHSLSTGNTSIVLIQCSSKEIYTKFRNTAFICSKKR